MTPNPQDSAVALEVERAAFEAWFLKGGTAPSALERDEIDYVVSVTAACWEGWQARASQSDGTSGGTKGAK